MPVTVTQEPGLIVGRFSEEVTADDLMEVAEHLDRIDRVTPGLPRLADATGITGVNLNFAAMARFADDRRQWSQARHVRTAILVDSDFGYGFGRMYQDLLHNPQITVEVFKDRQAAIAWLRASTNGTSLQT
jgi:hypothetical protein